VTEPLPAEIMNDGLEAAAAAKGWQLDVASGAAADLHRRELPDPAARAIWWFTVTRPTVVLGSTQPDDVIDRAAAHEAGVEVARRRSGGGAVWLAPGVATWVDVVVPAADPLWDDDVVRATRWLGHVWSSALGALGMAGTRVHEGRLVRRPWSGLVCFAGLGAGEVVAGGAKVVGVSQRRTRVGARFQCLVLHVWDPGPLLAVTSLEPALRATAAQELAGVARGIGAISPGDLVTALVDALPDP